MRKRVGTFSSRLEAEMICAQFEGLGVAASAIPAADPAPYHPNAMCDVWIEDASQLDDPEVRQAVDALLADDVLSPEEEDAIAEMTPVDPIEEPRSWTVPWFALIVAVIIIVAGLLWRAGAIRRAMEGIEIQERLR